MKHFGQVELVAAVILRSAVCAVAADNLPRFEVATLKQAPPPSGNYPITLGVVNGSRLNLTNVTLSDCVKFAYGLVSDDQISGPDWIGSTAILYDIVAKVSPDMPREQIMLMTQALLADRLKLAVHHEQKEMRYLALISDKSGPKMPTAITDADHPRNNSGGRGRVAGNRVSMPLLATLLSRLEHRIIVDRTGLPGEFEVALRWAPGSAGAQVTPDDSATGPSLFAAVQEQLGLRLESRKGPLDAIVIDSAERMPSEN